MPGVGGTLLALLVGTLPAGRSAAADLVGMYVGASVGQGRVEAEALSNPLPPTVATIGTFKEDHSAYKLAVGIRPVSVIGAEFEFVDFGHPSGGISAATSAPGSASASADVHMSGLGAFGMLFLPVPVVDIYIRAGLARIDTSGNVAVTLHGPILCVPTAPACQFSQASSTTDTGFAAGIGAQVKFGSWAVRAEYERFSAAGGYPSLASIGVTWTFL